MKPATRFTDDMTDAFEELQAVFEAEHNIEIRAPPEKARKEMQEARWSYPCLPMMGGTTPTTVLVSSDLLCVAWVGDSRAVLCCAVTCRMRTTAK